MNQLPENKDQMDKEKKNGGIWHEDNIRNQPHREDNPVDRVADGIRENQKHMNNKPIFVPHREDWEKEFRKLWLLSFDPDAKMNIPGFNKLLVFLEDEVETVRAETVRSLYELFHLTPDEDPILVYRQYTEKTVRDEIEAFALSKGISLTNEKEI